MKTAAIEPSWRSSWTFQGDATEFLRRQNRCSACGLLACRQEKKVFFFVAGRWWEAGVKHNKSCKNSRKDESLRKTCSFFESDAKENARGKWLREIWVPSLPQTMRSPFRRALCFHAWPFFISRAFFRVTFDELR